MFGFVSVDAKPMCLECGVMLTNDSMKKVKLLHHQKSKHSSSVDKDREYFERKKKNTASQTIRLYQEDEYRKCKDTQTKLFGL